MNLNHSNATPSMPRRTHCCPKRPASTKEQRAQVRSLVTKLLRDGFRLTVHDGEKTPVIKSRDVKQIMACLFESGQEDLLVYPPDSGTLFGRISIIYGIEVTDIIADCSVSLEEVLALATV